KFPANNDSDVEDLGNIILSPKVYYLEYLVDISDPKKLLQKKLVTLGFRQVNIIDFSGVGFLYEYQK
ncbi:MAG: hypothetical protein Q7J12_03460, partial [Syntrophales bacterium]|nr:hypothetical protein [Syntrophales bacterium]